MTANDPTNWHRDTLDVFKIVGSRIEKSECVPITFLDEVKPFERARIWSGLRDLVAMDILDTSHNPDQGVFITSSTNFQIARDVINWSSVVDIGHLKCPQHQQQRKKFKECSFRKGSENQTTVSTMQTQRRR
uniref:Uncharacterized protein n=1 Tax=Aureoumbra lagunensis TaxID=44058 RepID=A0A7S3K310_9STRA